MVERVGHDNNPLVNAWTQFVYFSHGSVCFQALLGLRFWVLGASNVFMMIATVHAMGPGQKQMLKRSTTDLPDFRHQKAEVKKGMLHSLPTLISPLTCINTAAVMLQPSVLSEN